MRRDVRDRGASRPGWGGRAPACAVAALVTLGGGAFPAGGLDAQVVRGRVLDDSTGVAIADATVSVLRGAERLGQVTTDPAGRFALALRDSATVRLEGRRPGWLTVRSQPLHVPAGDTVSVELWMGVNAIPLAPLYVTARSNLGRSRFRAHMEEWGKGIFFTPSMVDSIAPIHPVDLLRGQPETWLTWKSGERRSLPDIRTHLGHGCVKFMINGLEVRPWDEGLRMGVAGADAFEDTALEMLQGREIVAAEYYRYPGEAPPELRRYLELEAEAGALRMCGLVVFWTAEGW